MGLAFLNITSKYSTTDFFVIKPTRCTNFTNLFCHETLNVSDSCLSVIRSSFTVHSAAVEQDQDGTAVPSWSCPTAVYKPVWHIPLLSVQWINFWWLTDELSETCRVSWQNKFVKLVHRLGFITKIFVTMRVHMNVKFYNRFIIFTIHHSPCVLWPPWWYSFLLFLFSFTI